MPIKSKLPPFCGGFFYVDAATYGGEQQTAPKSANAHNVAKKLLAHPNVIFAHPVLGADDLLVMITGATPKEFLAALHGQLRSHFSDKHDYIVRTRSHTITSYYGEKAITREAFDKPSPIEAWMLLRVGVADPAAEIAEILLKDPRVTAVAPVLGEFDLFAFVEVQSLKELRSVVDETVRGKRHILDTSTLLVLRDDPK
jgi:DNA-binding Lrp family transcriptional regulator